MGKNRKGRIFKSYFISQWTKFSHAKSKGDPVRENYVPHPKRLKSERGAANYKNI